MWQDVVVDALCALFAIGAVAAAVWAIVTGQLSEQGIDGLFLVLVSLLVAAAFAPIALQRLRRRKPAKKKEEANAAG